MRLPRASEVAPAHRKVAVAAVPTVPAPTIGAGDPTTALSRKPLGELANRRRPTRPMHEAVPPSSDLSHHHWIRRRAGRTHPSRPNGRCDPAPARQLLL